MIQFLIDFAENNNGKLISTEWKGSKHKYEFETKCEKRFFMSYLQVKQTGWPKDINKYLKHIYEQNKPDFEKINELKIIAEKHNGKLISTEWRGTYYKYDFIFQDGKPFKRSATKLKSRGWPVSSTSFFKQKQQFEKKPEDFLNEMKLIAENNNGKLISTEWKGSKHKYQFIFYDNRSFSISQECIINDGWPKDPNYYFNLSNAKKKTKKDWINEMKLIAENNNGKLISTEWKGSKHKYQFEFQDGRKFFMQIKHVKNNGWPKDPNKYLKIGDDFLNEMSIIAKDRKGKLLDKIWLGVNNKYRFEDQYKNIFTLSYSSLIRGRWSPDRGLVTEPICRQVMEHLFLDYFPKNRLILSPKLTNLKFPLELDGYSENLNMAFEYQGYRSHWDVSDKDYDKVHKRDLLKEEICFNNNILLIVIPVYTNRDISNSKLIFQHVINSIEKTYTKLNIPYPQMNLNNFKIDFSIINYANEMLEKLKILAKDNNGKLISNIWSGNNELYEFEFSDGRTFFKSSKNIFASGWPKNLDIYLKTDLDKINEIKNIAKDNNSKLLSNEWKGVHHRYEFQLENGTLFFITASRIRKNGWPKDITQYLLMQERKCGEKYSKTHKFNECKEYAQNNNGGFLSTEYINNKNKLLWKCPIHNHIWEADYKKIIEQKTWCKYCK